MAANTHLLFPGGKRPGVARCSPGRVRGVLQWIDECHQADRILYRNALAVVVVLAVLLFLALRWGVL
jgi:hypothetical protein